MKKLFSLIVLSLLLASCGKEESSPKPQQVEELPQISIDKTPVPVTAAAKNKTGSPAI